MNTAAHTPAFIDNQPSSMTAEEARKITDDFKKTFSQHKHLVKQVETNQESAKKLICEIYEKRAYKALGYPNYAAYALAEFEVSTTQAYNLLALSVAKRNLEPVVKEELPKGYLRELGKLPEEQILEVWTTITPNDQVPTLEVVKKVVEKVRNGMPPKTAFRKAVPPPRVPKPPKVVEEPPKSMQIEVGSNLKNPVLTEVDEVAVKALLTIHFPKDATDKFFASLLDEVDELKALALAKWRERWAIRDATPEGIAEDAASEAEEPEYGSDPFGVIKPANAVTISEEAPQP